MTRLQDSGKVPIAGTRTRKEMGRRPIGIRRALLHEAKERASGAVKRDWEPRLIEARYLGQHARTGAMMGITADRVVCGRLGRRLPEAERWDQTGWQDLKGVPWNLRPTGVPETDQGQTQMRTTASKPRELEGKTHEGENSV